MSARAYARCTCRAHGARERRAHHRRCPGAHPSAWRARLPDFVQPEIDAILTGRHNATPLYRALVIETAVEARFAPLTVPTTRRNA